MNLKKSYEFVFWNDSCGLHLSELVRNVSLSHNVLWVVQRRTDGHLVDLDIKENTETDIGNADFITCECDKRQIESIIDQTSEAIHVNVAFTKWPPMCHMALKILCARRMKVLAFPLEAYPMWGLTGFLRRMKWLYLLNISYGKHVAAIGYTGIFAYNAYHRALVPDRRMFDIIYVTKQIDPLIYQDPQLESKSMRFVFVGQIVDRKNILYFTKVMQSLKLDCTFTIIGDGDQSKELSSLVANSTNINYIGKQENEMAKKVMCNSDVLVLPSKFDGWGAVVNEALQSGCRVLVSDHCGVSTLIRNNGYGEVFKLADKEDLIRCINNLMAKGKVDASTRQEIAAWALNHISGEVVSRYFYEICDYYLNNGTEKPKIPWK